MSRSPRRFSTITLLLRAFSLPKPDARSVRSYGMTIPQLHKNLNRRRQVLHAASNRSVCRLTPLSRKSVLRWRSDSGSGSYRDRKTYRRSLPQQSDASDESYDNPRPDHLPNADEWLICSHGKSWYRGSRPNQNGHGAQGGQSGIIGIQAESYEERILPPK